VSHGPRGAAHVHARAGTFDGADLTAARLLRADAADASFVGTTLKDADLRASSFRRADFSSAHLRGCNLDSSFLSEASLAGALVEGARGYVFGPVVV
jgi:uncharacterized protein YjbI with pentapeptide repeats